jgi:mono/diheme cytochrome c family protein
MPRSQMPPFTAKVLSDQQVADIYSYVQTFPKPPDPKTIPLLQN